MKKKKKITIHISRSIQRQKVKKKKTMMRGGMIKNSYKCLTKKYNKMKGGMIRSGTKT